VSQGLRNWHPMMWRANLDIRHKHKHTAIIAVVCHGRRAQKNFKDILG